MTPHVPVAAVVCFLLALPLWAQPDHLLRLDDNPDEQVFQLSTRLRHTTVITLPQHENILDFVVGDADYWHLTGAANVAYLKPTSENVQTNIALVCESGRIYAFLVTESSKRDPHLIVRFNTDQPDDGSNPLVAPATAPANAPNSPQPAFVARSSVAAFQAMAQQAAADAQAAHGAAQDAITTFRAAYPTRLQFPYRLHKGATKRPFLAEAMWHDGQFTYLRAHGAETPALYEKRDGQAAVVPYDLTEDGLFVVRRLLGDGWLQIGKARGRWSFIPPANPLQTPLPDSLP